MSEKGVLRLAEVRNGNVPTLESDPYIPVQVTWVDAELRRGPLPVYLRVSGLAGGELEFQVDRDSGELLVFTVILLGAIATQLAPPYPDVPPEKACGFALERALWEGTRDNVIFIEMALRPYRLPDGLRLDVAGVEPARLIECGSQLTLATDRDRVLASLTARIDIDERHFQS
jgi:hypothetical protein